MAQALPFLMFQGGTAEAAMNLYVSLFEDGEILSLKRFGPGEAGPEGSIMQARFRVAGQTVIAFDSPVGHAFDFTPSFSFFVDCRDEAEQDRLFATLSEGGKVLMPMADHGFSRRFAWCVDRFGISWQLNLP